MYFYHPTLGITKYLGESKGVSPVHQPNNLFVNVVEPKPEPSTGRNSGVPMGPIQLTGYNARFNEEMSKIEQKSKRGNLPSSIGPSNKINYNIYGNAVRRLARSRSPPGGRSPARRRSRSRSRSPPGGRSPARRRSRSPSRGRSRSPTGELGK